MYRCHQRSLARFDAFAYKVQAGDDFICNLVSTAVAVFVCRIGTAGDRYSQTTSVGTLDGAEGTLYRFCFTPTKPGIN